MVDVQFEEPGYQMKSSFQKQSYGTQSTMVGWVIKFGLAKNEKQANAVLLIIAALALIIALLIPKIFGAVFQTQPTVNPNLTPGSL